MPIGMFDSGVGGLSIFQEVMRQLPNESIVYLGDTERLPYGELDAQTIINYSLECGQFLNPKIKLLIVACNTATSYAIEILQKKLDIPVIGVIESTAKKAVYSTTNQRLALLATRATVRAKSYEKSIQALLPQSSLISIACPSFVPLIEEGFCSHSVTRILIRKYLKQLQQHKIDTLLLGCTHYFFLKSMIQEEIGSQVNLVDSTVSCTEQIIETLQRLNSHTPALNKPVYQFYVSGDPQKFRYVGEKLLKKPINLIEKVNWKL